MRVFIHVSGARTTREEERPQEFSGVSHQNRLFTGRRARGVCGVGGGGRGGNKSQLATLSPANFVFSPSSEVMLR